MQVFDLQMYGNRRKRLRYLELNVLRKISVDKTIGQNYKINNKMSYSTGTNL